jgi:hypothetical protein
MNNFEYLKDINFKKGRYYIGASDVPTIALMNIKYDQTPLTLWEEKTGRKKRDFAGERAKAGKDLEVIVLKWGLEKINYEFNAPDFISDRAHEARIYPPTKGKLISLTQATCRNYPFIVAHADLIEIAQPFIMEAKTTGFFGGKRGNDINYGYDKDDLTANGIPSSVYLQIQTQMLAYEINECYVSVMIDTGLHKLYGPIKAHKKTQEKVLAICERFWWHVEHDTAPKPEIWKDIIALNPILDVESKTVIAGTDLDKIQEMKDRAISLREHAKKIEAELKDIKNAVGLIIGKNAYLESDQGESLAKSFEVNRESVSIKDLREQAPRTLASLQKKGLIKHISYRDIRF